MPGVKPVKIELTDFTTKEVVDELEVDACLVATGRAPYTNGLNLGSVGVATDRRGFVPVNDKMQVGWWGRGPAVKAGRQGTRALRSLPDMQVCKAALVSWRRPPLPIAGADACPAPQVLDSNGKVVPHLYCIGDANGEQRTDNGTQGPHTARMRCPVSSVRPARFAAVVGRRRHCSAPAFPCFLTPHPTPPCHLQASTCWRTQPPRRASPRWRPSASGRAWSTTWQVRLAGACPASPGMPCRPACVDRPEHVVARATDCQLTRWTVHPCTHLPPRLPCPLPAQCPPPASPTPRCRSWA